MQLIKPRQISGEIMTLIEEADKRVILITPYFRVRNWHKMLNVLRSLAQRRIQIEVYIRKGEVDSLREVREIGIEPIEIPNLHTKLYLSEKVGIVSSMNILHSSDTNSLDIALMTETPKEYGELMEYYERYIAKAHSVYDWQSELVDRLSDALRCRVYLEEQGNKVIVQANNRYEVSIRSRVDNALRIVGILSDKEYEYAIKTPSAYSVKGMRVELQQGSNGQYDTITGIQGGLKSQQVTVPLHNEAEIIVDAVHRFIAGVEELKGSCANHKVA